MTTSTALEDSLEAGVDAARALIARVAQLSHSTVSYLDTYDEDAPDGEDPGVDGLDGRDYFAIAGVIETSIVENLVHAGPARREGFLRAMADTLTQHFEGQHGEAELQAGDPLHAWDPLRVTAASFLSRQVCGSRP
jgi:hypothetical protein